MNDNITIDDMLIAERVRKILLAVMAIPHAQLEHAVQLAHESSELAIKAPPEIFVEQGVTRQSLRMLWHFRCNLEALMPQEAGL